MVLKVVGALLALAIGIWIGMPGRAPGEVRRRREKVRTARGEGVPGEADGVHSEEGLQELELLLGRPDARRRRAKRHFTPLDLLRKERRSSHRRRSRRYFRTAPPESASDRGDSTKGGNSG